MWRLARKEPAEIINLYIDNSQFSWLNSTCILSNVSLQQGTVRKHYLPYAVEFSSARDSGNCEQPVHKRLRLSNFTIYFQKWNFMDFILSKIGDFEEATQVIGLDCSRLIFNGLFETTQGSRKKFMENHCYITKGKHESQRIKFNKNTSYTELHICKSKKRH